MISRLKSVAKDSQPLQWGLWAGLIAVGFNSASILDWKAWGLPFPHPPLLDFVHRSTPPTGGPFIEVSCSCVVVFSLCLSLWSPSILAQQHDNRLNALATSSTNPDVIHTQALDIARDNPADYIVPLKASDALSKITPFDARRFIAWNNHAQRLFPNGGQSNHLAAQTLVRNGLKSQSAGEYRRAFQKQPWKRLSILREIVGQYGDAERLLQAIPDTRRAQRSLFATLFHERKFETALRVTDELLKWSPNLVGAHRYRSRALYALSIRTNYRKSAMVHESRPPEPCSYSCAQLP